MVNVKYVFVFLDESINVSGSLVDKYEFKVKSIVIRATSIDGVPVLLLATLNRNLFIWRQVYFELSQTSKMECFAKIVND